MNGLIGGLFGLTDQFLEALGKGVMWILFGKRATADGPVAGYLFAGVGGIVLLSTVGAILGFALGSESAVFNHTSGAWLGGLVGGGLGMCFGFLVRFIDHSIAAWFNSDDSK
jgi:hypothetical protein